MLLSALFPTRDIGRDPAKIRDWAQAAEGLGYDCIEVADHVFGAAPRGDWKPTYSEHDPFHETFTTMAFIAAVTKNIKLCSGVLILPQRQTGVVAKQAARSRHIERRAAAPGRGCRLEPCRVRSARHGMEDARRAAGRADRGDAAPVDRGPGHVQGQVPHADRRQHAAGARSSGRSRSGSAGRPTPWSSARPASVTAGCRSSRPRPPSRSSPPCASI